MYVTGLKVLSMLKKSKLKCSLSKNPEKCKRFFDSEIIQGLKEIQRKK